MRPVYPRVCGATITSLSSVFTDWGLSPRVRGNRIYAITSHLVSGSIPACAGQPLRLLLSGPSARVYPRVCGATYHALRAGCRSDGLSPRVRGNPCAVEPSGGASGLSPRVRGNPDTIGLRSMLLRSIPACAGQPDQRRSERTVTWVYPRVCGATIRIRQEDFRLSPRVRGNLKPVANQ